MTGKLRAMTTASSLLTVDLDALAQNYTTMRSLVLPPCKVTAVVKADAYGLGIEQVAKALNAANVRTYFVATIDEAIELRKHTDRKIATLNGFFRGAEKEYLEHDIIPVLCSLDEIDRWTYSKRCFWQVDTGMNRLGLRPHEFDKAFERAHYQPAFIMSHLACADDPAHPKNDQQRKELAAIETRYPLMRYSLANSSGIYLGSEYHFDMVRPGMALYGLNPMPELENPMQNVVTLETRVLQIHESQEGETAGYGATYKFERPAKLATVSLGYADGFLRAGSNQAKLYWQGQPCPVVGRVSMDLIIVDISNLPVNIIPPYEGDFLEVIGPSQSADALAASFGTIGYEVFTSLSRRAERIYKTSSGS
ncbi:MAG: alanine racemase [Micavibrio aeruginosavorus]|uniref:Alanine racemase n=1 Tax=Micavibrio aeruginosavorus TaxID=349221 RepID=A0A2W5FPP4_9BACT|nr:MAG: alanine racemase [Micavibrio aeruginosavorus]